MDPCTLALETSNYQMALPVVIISLCVDLLKIIAGPACVHAWEVCGRASARGTAISFRANTDRVIVGETKCQVISCWLHYFCMCDLTLWSMYVKAWGRNLIFVHSPLGEVWGLLSRRQLWKVGLTLTPFSKWWHHHHHEVHPQLTQARVASESLTSYHRKLLVRSTRQALSQTTACT